MFDDPLVQLSHKATSSKAKIAFGKAASFCCVDQGGSHSLAPGLFVRTNASGGLLRFRATEDLVRQGRGAVRSGRVIPPSLRFPRDGAHGRAGIMRAGVVSEALNPTTRGRVGSVDRAAGLAGKGRTWPDTSCAIGRFVGAGESGASDTGPGGFCRVESLQGKGRSRRVELHRIGGGVDRPNRAGCRGGARHRGRRRRDGCVGGDGFSNTQVALR